MSRVDELVAQAAQATLDAYNTTVKSLITPVFNVIGYGATGDGVTDDTTAIKAAITAAAAAGTGTQTGIVYFPPGNYLVTASLPVERGYHFLGAGQYATTIIAGITGGGSIFKNASLIGSTNDVHHYAATFESFDVKLNNDNDIGIDLTGMSDCTIRDVYFYCSDRPTPTVDLVIRGTGVKLALGPTNSASCYENRIENCMFQAVTLGVSIGAAANFNHIHNSSFLQNTKCVDVGQGATLCSLVSNRFETSVVGAATGVVDNGTNTYVAYNTSEGWTNDYQFGANYNGCYYVGNVPSAPTVAAQYNNWDAVAVGQRAIIIRSLIGVPYDPINNKGFLWLNDYLVGANQVTQIGSVGAAPNGVKTANVAALYSDEAGGWWIKETGAGNTGWHKIKTHAQGRAAIGAGLTAVTVILPVAEPDTNYAVNITPLGWNAGGVWMSNHNETQFQANFATAPGVSAFFAWSVVR